uniref:Probable histone-lysine N-methyltransferase NSD2 n=1 Tax=Hydra vulgaris TaxID=6087 RepID=T2MHJ6_HYDVU
MKPKVKKVYAGKSKAKNKSSQTNKKCSEAICFLPLSTNQNSPEKLKDIISNFDYCIAKLPPIDSYLVGDVFWAKIPGHNWWPSMISYDPITAVFCQMERNSIKYHVQFFGDTPTRGWVSKTNLMDFSGLDAFLSLPKSLGTLKFSSSSVKESWSHAVIQAQSALSLDRKQRKIICTYSYKNNLTLNNKVKISNKVKSPKIATEESFYINKKSCTLKSNASNYDSKLTNCSQKNVNSIKLLNGSCKDSSKVVLKEVPLNAVSMDIIEAKRTRKKRAFQDFHTESSYNEENKLKKKGKGKIEKLKADINGWSEKENLSSEELKKESFKKSPYEPISSTLKSPQDYCMINSLAEKTTSKKLNLKKRKTEKNITVNKGKVNVEVINNAANNDAAPSKKRKLTSIEVFKTEKNNKLELTFPSKVVPTTISTSAMDINQVKLDPELSELWPNLKKDLYCCICEGSEGQLITCQGSCFNSFHFDCLGVSCIKTSFTCDECLSNNHCCFFCKKPGAILKCSHNMCGKHYHQDCLIKIPVIKSNVNENNANKFICPLHNCRLCSEKASKGNLTKLLKCIRCPTAYHQSSCLVAGCTIITSNNMICDCHFEPQKNNTLHSNINVTWCFICSQGGSLVCCDTCPASFHVECYEDLKEIPENSWQCNDCLQRKKPIYNDIVWVKYGVYRWWPAKICIPSEIPERILKIPHIIGQFPVMFFGSKDYSWVHSGRVFKYQDGDKGGNSAGKLSVSLANYFKKAVEEAREAFAELEKQRAEVSEILGRKITNKPQPFKLIKSNKPVSCIRNILDQSEWPVCECSKETFCSSDSECLNRMLLFECNAKTCPAGNLCQNQQIQKNESKKCHPFKCEGRGWGLMADTDIKQGEFVIEYVGELIDEETCHRRVREYHEKDIFDYYFLTIDKDNIIDAYPKGNMSRFMNHSCNPNCETQKWTVNGEIRVALFATRDIKMGEELCFNYNLDSLGNDKKQCKCGAVNCSGFLGVPPKTQHSMAIADKGKLKKKKIKKQQKIVHDNDCFVCGDGGELIMCSRNKCSKTYHIKCLKLDKRPYGRWECPWHYCDVCGKLAKSLCVLCPNSYCDNHSENDIILMNKHFFCIDHEEKEISVFFASKEDDNSVKPKFDFSKVCDLKGTDTPTQVSDVEYRSNLKPQQEKPFKKPISKKSKLINKKKSIKTINKKSNNTRVVKKNDKKPKLALIKKSGAKTRKK